MGGTPPTVGSKIPHNCCSGKTTHLPGIKKRGIELKKCGICRKLYSCRELTNVCPPETNGFPLDSGQDLQASGQKTSHLPGIKKPGIELKTSGNFRNGSIVVNYQCLNYRTHCMLTGLDGLLRSGDDHACARAGCFSI